MFNIDVRPSPRPLLSLLRINRLFETSFDRRQRKLARKIEQFRAMDDERLAELGLARDEIVMYVFKSF